MARALGGVEPTQTPERAAPAPRSPKRRAKRGRTAKLARQIEDASRERQALWAEGGHANDVQKRTTDLNGPAHVLRPEGLFAAVRHERRGEMPDTIRRAGPSPADDRRPGGGMAR